MRRAGEDRNCCEKSWRGQELLREELERTGTAVRRVEKAGAAVRRVEKTGTTVRRAK